MKYLLTLTLLCIITTVTVFSQWKEINNGLNGGAVTSLIENKGVLYAGCAVGGLYVSKDSAVTWQSIDSDLPKGMISSIAKSNGNLIATAGTAVYYSTDEGKHWSPSDSGDLSIRSIAVIGDTVFAATWKRTGIYISTNKGVSWSLCSNQGLSNLDVREIGIYKTKLFAATYGGGMYMSSDFGEHWVERNNGMIDNKLVSLSVCGDTLFSTVYRGESYLSSDGGESWNRMIGLPINYGVEKVIKYPIGLIGIKSNHALISVDSGNTWKGLIPYGYFLTYISCIQAGDKVILASGDLNGASMYYTLDTGKTLVECNTGMRNATVLSLAKSNNILYTGTMGNAVYRSQDNGVTWEATNRVWGMDIASQLLVHGDTIFAGTQYRGLYVSYNGGTTWQKTGNFFSAGMGVLALTEDNNTVYLGTNRSGDGLYTSTDFGQSWVEKKNGFVDNIGIAS
ncbi:MAG: hypothetical protein JNJ85_06860, partial [Candidatus Kapabacteria bacterium]|nr:hypothetical protein [Candidatus Kapabacteria bacterium]